MTVPPAFDPLESKLKMAGEPEWLRRDRWTRPLIVPRGGTIPIPYTRASSLADFIVNKRGLQLWRERHMMRGIGMRSDLAMLAAAETYNTGFGMADEGANMASGRRLDQIGERALDAAQASVRADYGTVVHRHTEADAQAPLDPLAAADVSATNRPLRACTVLAEEVFVACDEVTSSGSFDKLIRLPGMTQATVYDLKTGKLHMEAFGVQLAVYANGEIVEEDGSRHTLESQFGPINTDWAIVAHTAAQTGEVNWHKVDLIDGMEAARHAAWVRDYQKRSHISEVIDLVQLTRNYAAELMTSVGIDCEEDLHGVWEMFSDVWTQELTDLGNRLLSQSTK